MKNPTFLILGAAKSGTSSLAQYISTHPEVALSKPKEPHFFDANYSKGMSYYLTRHFKNWRHEKVAGEATPSYLIVPYVAERILHEIPQVKLIVILRNPVMRAFSSWWMFHARRMEQLSFADAISLEERQISEGRHPLENPQAESIWSKHIQNIRLGRPIDIRTYLYAGHYAHHIQRFLRLFPRENIKIIFSNHLRERPHETLCELWQFLGVPTNVSPPSFRAENEAISASARPFLKLIQASGLMPLRKLIPATGVSWIKRRISKYGPPLTIDPTSKMHLESYFEPHIRELESLLDVDLSMWRK